MINTLLQHDWHCVIFAGRWVMVTAISPLPPPPDMGSA